MIKQEPDFQSLIPQFCFEGEFIRGERHGFGHINDTYIVYFEQAGSDPRKYILQRINHDVFKNPIELMKNIEAVTAHLRQKVIAASGDPERETLTLLLTRSGETHYKTADGFYWRSYQFIENALTYQTPANLQQVYNAAHTFGSFQQMLEDFQVEQLFDTIPDFHHTPKRFDSFVQAVEKDVYNRARDVKDEISFVLNRADQMRVLMGLIEQGRLPVRVTHNDTKFNNLLIDTTTGKGLCVIDLDTVMRGTVLYDFGDAIRSICNTAVEDERDLSLVRFNRERFEQFVRGYLDTMRNSLVPDEITTLPLAAKLMTLECGMRFLTDYLNGDVYFRTKHQDHNLDRCRVQFKLLQEMEEDYSEMVRAIKKIADL